MGQLRTADFEGTVYVYTPEAYEEEEYIADRIREMAAMKPLSMKTHVQLFLDRCRIPAILNWRISSGKPLKSPSNRG